MGQQRLRRRRASSSKKTARHNFLRRVGSPGSSTKTANANIPPAPRTAAEDPPTSYLEPYPGAGYRLRSSFGYRVADDVTFADAQRIAALQDGVLLALLQDPRVVERLDRWRAPFLKALQPRAGRLHLAPIFRNSLRFVREELGLPWPWLAFELAQVGLQRLAERIPDRIPLIAEALPMPGLEEAKMCQQRALKNKNLTERGLEHMKTMARLVSSDRSDHRAPKAGGAALRTSGRWFYEARVRKPARTVSAIARDTAQHRAHSEKDLHHCGCRRTVTRALREARRLFSLIRPIS